MVAQAVPCVIATYLDLLTQPPDPDPKLQQLHQAACKAALQHLDALLKLPAGDRAGGAVAADTVDDILARAEAEVARFEALNPKPQGPQT